MSPSDRQVVHDTINELEGLETSSEGLEPRRYVVIRPASSPPNEQSPINLTEQAADQSEEVADLS